jgi:polysaccharide biosynthesis protein PslH
LSHGYWLKLNQRLIFVSTRELLCVQSICGTIGSFEKEHTHFNEVAIRILWISHFIPYPPKDGASQRSFNLLKRLSLLHKIDLVCLHSPTHSRNNYETIEAGVLDSKKALQELGANVYVIRNAQANNRFQLLWLAMKGLFFKGGYQVSKVRNRELDILLQELVKSNRYAIAHFDTIGLAQYQKLLHRTPSTLGHHNVESHRLFRRSKLEEKLLHRVYFAVDAIRVKAFEKRVASNFAAHITCSTLDSTRLAAHTNHPQIVTIPNSVDVNYFKRLTDESPQQSMVFVGTMSWYPNADAMYFFLVEVWPELKMVCPKLHLHIVGSGAPKKIVTLAHNSKDVTMHGFVDDIRPIVEAATLYVCPVRTGGGTRLKILDAFALEKCVVAHPVASEGIEAIDTKEIVLAETPRGFTEAIANLLTNRAERHRIGMAARVLVTRQYSDEKVSQQLSDLFEQISRTDVDYNSI